VSVHNPKQKLCKLSAVLTFVFVWISLKDISTLAKRKSIS